MKRKVVNPNPQEKKFHKIEEKIFDAEIKEQVLKAEEVIDKEKDKLKESKKK